MSPQGTAIYSESRGLECCRKADSAVPCLGTQGQACLHHLWGMLLKSRGEMPLKVLKYKAFSFFHNLSHKLSWIDFYLLFNVILSKEKLKI